MTTVLNSDSDNDKIGQKYLGIACIFSVLAFTISIAISILSGLTWGGQLLSKFLLYVSIPIEFALPLLSILLSLVAWRRGRKGIGPIALILLNSYILLPIVTFLIDYL